MSAPLKSSAKIRLQTVEAMNCDPRLKALPARIGTLLVTRYWSGARFIETGELEAYPGLPRLCADTGSSSDSVSDALRRLVALGYLQLIERGVGRGVNSRYRIIPHVPRRVQKTPAASGVFLGFKTPASSQVFEVDTVPATGVENTGIRPPEKAGNDGAKTPHIDGPNPGAELFQKNPSRAGGRP